ncbi:lysostaphin resistance A-like protein [Pseudalkalibacillus sp. Hm43]|uniref:CPBP family intramembrane glutamic endopeptidase n=1 Tax=Pseudalkalibacillus sp. Hm43 TaxID=3450742 RepID=UPI003F41D41A
MGNFFRSILLAYILIGVAFQSDAYFWIVFPLVQGVLLLFALVIKSAQLRFPSFKQWGIAIVSGIGIYGLFAIGKVLILAIVPSMFESLKDLYGLIQPKSIWHTILVFVLIIPAEEWFWRGYVQTRLQGSTPYRVFLSVSLYALAHLASGSILLVLAAFFAGLIWAYLYEYSKSIIVPLVSHLVFDILLFVVFPLL